jgi:hypothetical protein
MNSDNDNDASEQRIRHRAFAIWEEEARPDGRHLEHWQRAQREVEFGEKAVANPADKVKVPGAAPLLARTAPQRRSPRKDGKLSPA